MAIYAVQYRYIDDAEKLAEHRPAHRRYNASLLGRGLVAGGPYVDTAGALLLYVADDRTVVDAALDGDPFWIEGCIAERSVHEWTPVTGGIGV